MARNSVTSCMSQNEKGPQLWKTVPDWALFQISLFCFWGFWDFWGYGQCFNDNQWMGNGCRINGWSASHPSGVSKCPHFSHHSTIGDILSPTDTLVMFNPPKGDTCQPLSMDLDFIQKRLLDCCPFPTGNGRFAATCMILMGVIPWLGVVSGEGSVLPPQTRGSFWIGFRMKRRKLTRKLERHPTLSDESSNIIRIQSMTHLGMGQKPTFFITIFRGINIQLYHHRAVSWIGSSDRMQIGHLQPKVKYTTLFHTKVSRPLAKPINKVFGCIWYVKDYIQKYTWL